MARSTARKRALNTLYEADVKDADILDLLAEREKNPGATSRVCLGHRARCGTAL